MVNRFVREPLVHFALLGAALFGGYGLIAPQGSDATAIVVSSDQIVSLAEQFRGTWQRAPTREELERLIETRIRDEVLYREGLALGLDRDDPVVRNRVKQKMEILSADTLTAEPTDAELQAYLDAHREEFILPATVSFEQVFFDPAQRGAALGSDLRQARAVLREGGRVNGDRTMLPPQMERVLPRDIQTAFGTEFEKAMHTLLPGAWSEPVRSSFGYHLVRVTARTEASHPTLAEARDVVEREWSQARTVDARERLYRSLRDRYFVEIGPIPQTVPLTARVGDLQ